MPWSNQSMDYNHAGGVTDSSFGGFPGIMRLPSVKDFPLLRMLEIDGDLLRNNVPGGYTPIGARKRIQSVIETVYLDDADDDNEEYDMNDLGSGNISYDGFSKKIKKEVADATFEKDPDDTFMEGPEERGILLAKITIPDIKVEDEGEDEGAHFTVPVPKIVEVDKAMSGFLGSAIDIENIIEMTTYDFSDHPTEARLTRSRAKLMASPQGNVKIEKRVFEPKTQLAQENSKKRIWKRDIDSVKLGAVLTGSDPGKSSDAFQSVKPPANHSGQFPNYEPTGVSKPSKIKPIKAPAVFKARRVSSQSNTFRTDGYPTTASTERMMPITPLNNIQRSTK